MLFFDLSFIPVLVMWAGIIMFLNVFGFIKTKSIFNCINLAISLTLLFIHMHMKESLPNWSFCVACDLVFLAISVSLYIYLNDIETRRKVISEVFENRYQKPKKNNKK